MDKQRTFFDSEHEQHLARLSDPVESHAAGEKIRPKLGKLQQIFIDVLRHTGEAMTAKEIESTSIRLFKLSRAEAESVRKRAAEVVRGDNNVEKLRSGIPCRVTGAKVARYRIINL